MTYLAQNLQLPGSTPLIIQGPVDTGLFMTSTGNITIGSIISAAIPYILVATGIGLLLMIISSGFTLLTSAGDPKKMDAGRQQVTNAVIGFILVVTAYWLTQIVGKIFGITAIGEIFP